MFYKLQSQSNHKEIFLKKLLDASITHYQFVSSLGGRVTTSGNHTKKLSIYIVWYYCWGGGLIYIYLSIYVCIFAMKFWGSFWLSPPIHRIVAQRLFRVEFKDVSCSWNWKCNDHLPFLSLSLSLIVRTRRWNQLLLPLHFK